ncbi:MAG: FkbM family methyltransferase [Pseudonocardiales bacterium]|nr:MAG: FkbM family methyltransferase [Pseudonocardiales bacterium]
MPLKDRAWDGTGRLREYAKIALRSTLHKRNFDLVRNPYPVRVATALTWLGIDTVLDVGANIGQYGSALRSSGFTGWIISCEPLSDAFGHLARRAGSDLRWTPLQTAVGDAPGRLEINISANSYSSSILPMTAAHLGAAPGSQFTGTERVPVTTVAALVSEHRVRPGGALLKVDTQGYEGPVLDGAAALLADFAAVQLELSFVALYEGQQLFGELADRLAGAGYAMYGLDAGFADPRTGRMLQCDALFVRNDLLPDTPGLHSGPR